MTDSNGDLVERVQRAILAENVNVMMRADPKKVASTFEREARVAIAAVLDDLQSPDEWMLEAFYARWEQGHNPESFNTLLGDALTAMMDCRRKQLGLASPVEPGDAPKPVSGTQQPQDS